MRRFHHFVGCLLNLGFGLLKLASGELLRYGLSLGLGFLPEPTVVDQKISRG